MDFFVVWRRTALDDYTLLRNNRWEKLKKALRIPTRSANHKKIVLVNLFLVKKTVTQRNFRGKDTGKRE